MKEVAMRRLRFLLSLTLLLAACTSLLALTPTPLPSETPLPTATPVPTAMPTSIPDATLLAKGWAALAAGDLDSAERIA
jgi:hypothetical protein